MNNQKVGGAGGGLVLTEGWGGGTRKWGEEGWF